MEKLILESVQQYCFQNCGLTGEQWSGSVKQKYSGMNRFGGWKPRAVHWFWFSCSFRRVRYFENDAGIASCVPRKAKYYPDSDREQVVWTKDEKYSEKRVISTWNWLRWITLDTSASIVESVQCSLLFGFFVDATGERCSFLWKLNARLVRWQSVWWND